MRPPFARKCTHSAELEAQISEGTPLRHVHYPALPLVQNHVSWPLGINAVELFGVAARIRVPCVHQLGRLNVPKMGLLSAPLTGRWSGRPGEFASPPISLIGTKETAPRRQRLRCPATRRRRFWFIFSTPAWRATATSSRASGPGRTATSFPPPPRRSRRRPGTRRSAPRPR